MPEVSIVMSVFNNSHLTASTLADIQRTADMGHEVIVVDNGSTDDTWPVLQTFAGIRRIQNPSNLCLAASWNVGLRAAKGNVIIVLANNTYMHCDDWMSKLARMVKGKKVLAGPLVRAENKMSEYGGRIYPYVEGWCCAFDRQALTEVGYYDEQFEPWGFEDTEFSARATVKGYEIKVCRVQMRHPRGATAARFWASRIPQINATNRERFIAKMKDLTEEKVAV